jgi:hypothetical protein
VGLRIVVIGLVGERFVGFRIMVKRLLGVRLLVELDDVDCLMELGKLGCSYVG